MKVESSGLEWYIICNPTSGGGINTLTLERILSVFKKFKISYKIILTQYAHHEAFLVKEAIKKGYMNFVCIGGDGTIHHMINGIMKQKFINPKKIALAVIPKGTGNDWVKNYKIPKSEEQAIELVLKNNRITQDIGKIILTDTQKTHYFTNAAGIGFDAFVVKNIQKFRKWKKLSYLLGGLTSFSAFRDSEITYQINKVQQRDRIFMINIGLCKFSGGGMQLTDYKNHQQGLFDLTIIKSIRFFRIITNLNNLYNGRIDHVREADCSRVKSIKISDNCSYYLQADGELIGSGRAEIKIIPSSIQFLVP